MASKKKKTKKKTKKSSKKTTKIVNELAIQAEKNMRSGYLASQQGLASVAVPSVSEVPTTPKVKPQQKPTPHAKLKHAIEILQHAGAFQGSVDVEGNVARCTYGNDARILGRRLHTEGLSFQMLKDYETGSDYYVTVTE